MFALSNIPDLKLRKTVYRIFRFFLTLDYIICYSNHFAKITFLCYWSVHCFILHHQSRLILTSNSIITQLFAEVSLTENQWGVVDLGNKWTVYAVPVSYSNPSTSHWTRHSCLFYSNKTRSYPRSCQTDLVVMWVQSKAKSYALHIIKASPRPPNSWSSPNSRGGA